MNNDSLKVEKKGKPKESPLKKAVADIKTKDGTKRTSNLKGGFLIKESVPSFNPDQEMIKP